ncbi:hypothetical protein [Stappia sp.]|uniref:hypothetical protein n=1 Tax=Stappia sp. TaxID=1870903 RepID=UPI003C7A4FDE
MKMKGFFLYSWALKAVLVFVCLLFSPSPSAHAEPFDAEVFMRDVREYRTFTTGGLALSRDDGRDWFRVRSPWLPFLEKQVSEALSPDARQRLHVAVTNRECGEVAEIELAAYKHLYPELRLALAETDIGPLFRKAMFPIYSRAFSYCQALRIVEPLVAEAQRLTEEWADEVDVHTAQYFIGIGRATATRSVELDDNRLFSATFVLKHLAACHHHAGALEFLLRVDAQLKSLKYFPDQGIYLVRLGEALGIGAVDKFEPLTDLWDEEVRARIERINRVFDENSLDDAVHLLPYRDDACDQLPGYLTRLHEPRRDALHP